MKSRGSVATYYILIAFLLITLVFMTTSILMSSNIIQNSTLLSEQAYNNAEAGLVYVYRNIIKGEGEIAKDRTVVLNFDNNNSVEVVFKNKKYEKKYSISVKGRCGTYIKSIYKEISYK
ncbi:hypothetical protein [Caloramator proteoclasticus]|uniref:Uncharacterized protein n=1 Tax=Caloramator proteoclasticus DSM 10124 TaxID=1121262 RepID=A0A1M4Y9Q0_9CLOT|nr:hypothetical protein [Caloramator proteoclasticus]SHF02363.1 hypothetical protein SAMN02746091_01614 [Caloramator proteoclasticus DSM 10124]